LKDRTVLMIIVLIFALLILGGSLGLSYFYTPGDEDFIPVKVIFEDDINNITLSRGSSTDMALTLVSSLQMDMTVKITPVFNSAMGGFDWFSAEVEPNPVNLGPFGTQFVDLTVSVAGDTPSDVLSDMLLLQLNSTQFNVYPWSPTRVVFVESP